MSIAKKTALFALITLALLLVCGGGRCDTPIDPAAHKQFRGRLGSMTVTVFPTAVRTSKITYDEAAAKNVGAFLNDQKLATTTLSTEPVALSSAWGINESKMWRRSAASLSDHVALHPIKTDYAMLAEYLIDGGGKVGAVHCYVVDARGVVAAGIGLNSHHKLFNKINPKSVEACTTLLIEAVREEFVKEEKLADSKNGKD